MDTYAMLISENRPHQAGMVFIMSDFAILIASMKSTLYELAKQSAGLGIGLQNAAPGDKTLSSPNNSVQYLMATSESLAKLVKECDKLSTEVLDSVRKVE